MKKFFLFILNASFGCFLGVLGFTYLTPTSGGSELLSHFAFQYVWISLLYLVFYGFYRKKMAMVLAFVAFLGTTYSHISPLTPLAASPSPREGEEVSILQLNLWYKIDDVDQVFDYIKKNDFPDILVFEEVTPYLLARLQPLRDHYTHTFEAPEAGAYGMAIFSKIPLVGGARVPFKEGRNFYTVLELRTPQREIPFTLIELHTTSPARDLEMTVRRQELEEMALGIPRLPGDHKILVGDLNTTPYSPYFTQLLRGAGLKNSMEGDAEKWITGTWPTFLPSFCRIPLDHLLMSSKIHRIQREVGPSVGSDHLPVLTRLFVEQ